MHGASLGDPASFSTKGVPSVENVLAATGSGQRLGSLTICIAGPNFLWSLGFCNGIARLSPAWLATSRPPPHQASPLGLDMGHVSCSRTCHTRSRAVWNHSSAMWSGTIRWVWNDFQFANNRPTKACYCRFPPQVFPPGRNPPQFEPKRLLLLADSVARDDGAVLLGTTSAHLDDVAVGADGGSVTHARRISMLDAGSYCNKIKCLGQGTTVAPQLAHE